MSSLPSVKILFLFTGVLSAEPGAKLIIPESEAWTGQRLPFFVELRAEGTFSGAASFDLPEIPKTVIIKIGNPIISSETKGDTEYFVQRHEFALFSQASGSLQLPPITARFSHKKGYTGPDFDTSADTTSSTLTLKRPPNSDALGFIVTTGSLEIEETWDPTPGPLETGAVLKRTIIQRAAQLTGIALKPAPTPPIDGIRSYPGSPEVIDKTERGQFLGERRDTLTYLVQQPGLHTLPEIRFDWWNPDTESLESKTLPAVTFTATAPPPPPEKPSPARLPWLLAPILLSILGLIYHRPIRASLRRLHQRLDPPPNKARREFLRACRRNDAEGASHAWARLRSFHPNLAISDELRQELSKLQSLTYGPNQPTQDWSGQSLAEAYSRTIASHDKIPKKQTLPELNP